MPQLSATAKPSGRRAATKALLAIDKAGLLPDDLFDKIVERESLDQRERAFMVELVRGVLRYRGTLDWRLGLLIGSTDRATACARPEHPPSRRLSTAVFGQSPRVGGCQ